MKMDRTPFESLATDMEASWLLSGKDLAKFTELATDRLTALKYDANLDEFHTNLTRWLATTASLPDQVNLHNTFGQPPITVFNNGELVVDIYIWRGCDTSIHSHGFRGAFKVLHGQSLHEIFAVETESKITPDVSLTRLGRPRLEILSAGDVRRIEPDQALTHRVIHLVDPTITLCVKTLNEPEISQWHHFESGVAIKKRNVDPGHFKKAYYFQYLTETDEEAATGFLKQWIASIDLSTRMNLCEDLSMGVCDLPDVLVQRILECACEGFEATEWFRRFQKSSIAQSEDIMIADDLSPELRLAVHFANTGWKYSDAEPWLEKVCAKIPAKIELTRSVLLGLDEENPAFELQQKRWKDFIDT